MSAVAVLDWGRWVADCPNPVCTNAMQLTIGQREFRCEFPTVGLGGVPMIGGCRAVAPIVWPDNPGAILGAVAGKPESARNWRPDPLADPEPGGPALEPKPVPDDPPVAQGSDR